MNTADIFLTSDGHRVQVWPHGDFIVVCVSRHGAAPTIFELDARDRETFVSALTRKQ